jgi:predicted metal-dependent hydrolase
VVHELAHVKEKNHGTNFWKIVDLYKPDYQISKEKLKQLAWRIRQDGWERS